MIADAPFRWTDPGTWPWIFYVWLAVLAGGWLLGLWRWLQRKRAAGWPIADGRIQSAEVKKPSFSLTTRRGQYIARLRYSYSAGGNIYSGVYKREFPTEHAGNEFIRDLEGRAVSVRYNPSKSSKSAVLESDIEAVLQNRSPSVGDDLLGRNAVPEWLRPFIWVFVWASAIGLVVSLWVHIGALLGHSAPSIFWVLHVGIFVVWIPAVFVAQRLAGNTRRADFWKVVLKGAPDWMRYMVYFFFAYAAVNFIFYMTQIPAGGRPALSSQDWRGFSGHWMAFYSAALAILYSAAKITESSPRCANGHSVSPNALYCTRCGQPVLRVR